MSKQEAPTASNRSLERGIEILRAFRQGSQVLGNSDLVERTGLPKATISRLSHSLVSLGILQYDGKRRGFRLAPAVLSFAHAMRSASEVLSVAAPLMSAMSQEERVNVGLAAPDRDEMVYLESMRYNRRVVFRQVVSGQRIPMELTSLGRAYLSVAPSAIKASLFETFSRRRGAQWERLYLEIEAAAASVRKQKFCAAAWQPGVVAVATPLKVDDAVYALNCSVSTADDFDAVVAELSGPLLQLRAEVEKRLTMQGGA